jgi:F0F1-type ATP synthase assembly protein I
MDARSRSTSAPRRVPRLVTPNNGEDLAWHAMSILLAGPLTWGGVGALIDHLAGTGRTFLPIGIVVGAVTAFYLVKVRFGRDHDRPDAGVPRSS